MAEVDESEIPPVRRVCHDFMVREDSALAHRLQEEEFGHHYIRNRSERKTVREDIKAAKETYLEEVKNANILPEEELTNMEQTEKWLARDLHQKLCTEETNSERRKTDLELRDEEIARQLQEKEALKLERARQRKLEKQRMEEHERRMLQEAVMGLQEGTNDHVVWKEKEDTQRKLDAVPSTRSRNDLVDVGDMSSQGSSSRGKKNSSKDPRNRYSLGEGAVVRLPTSEGGRLESDRIIMADGTTIDLFDDCDSKIREEAQRKSRERQDEEFARQLQEEENKLVEQDRQAEDDRKIAVEFQDMELAKELQRREYIRLQKLKRERQLRRAQTVPAESTSGSSGELQAHQRLPSYEEAIHRHQIPDLLQDEPSFRREHGHYRDEFVHHKHNSAERCGPSSKGAPFEQDRRSSLKGASQIKYRSSVSSSLDRQQSCEEEPVWSSRNSSAQSSLERSMEYSEQSQRLASGSAHSLPRDQAKCGYSESPTSPHTREGIWEKLYEESEEIPHYSRRHRGIERSHTVATSEPSQHVTDPSSNTAKLNRTDCNIAEFIDPTFKRRQWEGDEAGASSTTTNTDTKPKSMPLIQPQRRRSSDKKKKDKDGQKDCKQQ